MSKPMELHKDALSFAIRTDQEDYLPQKGQRIIYEGKEAEVIRVKPLCVIKTKNRVVCGALQNRFEYVGI